MSGPIREIEMCRLYREGLTLREIGERFSLTRERIRQLISQHGLSRIDGGQTIKTFLRRVGDRREFERAEKERREQRCRDRWGIGLDEYHALVSLYGNTTKNTSPFRRILEQRRNAKVRHIPWCLTFKQWWDIWQESGKWDLRGRGKGYCMARYGDSGPYAIGNIYICTIGQNFSDGYITKPWKERFANVHRVNKTSRGFNISHNKRRVKNPFSLYEYPSIKYLGCFQTRELAEAAGRDHVSARARTAAA